MKGAGAELIVTASSDLVDRQNTVLENERRAFLGVLEDNGIEYKYIEALRESSKRFLMQHHRLTQYFSLEPGYGPGIQGSERNNGKFMILNPSPMNHFYS